MFPRPVLGAVSFISYSPYMLTYARDFVPGMSTCSWFSYYGCRGWAVTRDRESPNQHREHIILHRYNISPECYSDDISLTPSAHPEPGSVAAQATPDMSGTPLARIAGRPTHHRLKSEASLPSPCPRLTYAGPSRPQDSTTPCGQCFILHASP